MIDPKELRIGNLVINDHTKEIVPVTVMLLMVQYENSDGKWIDSNPITITPEWLERLGFESDTILGFHVKYSLYGIEIWNDTALHTFWVDNIKNKMVFLKYIHQLQNIYHALTGQELTVKELTTTI